MWWDTVKSIEDLYKLVEFEKLVHPERDWLTVDEYASWLRMGLQTTVLKESTKKWKGSYQTINSGDGNVIFVGFGRHPDYKGKGIGQILMNRLIALNKKNGSLICETRQNNKSMIRLLKANNFRLMKEEFRNDEDWTWWKFDGGNSGDAKF